MTARLLCNVIHTMLLESHGPEKVAELLEDADVDAQRSSRLARLADLGIEVN